MSFAEVYRAGLEVTVKIKEKKVAIVYNVQQEVKMHCQLEYPSTLELYNYFEDRTYVYLVL